MSSSHQVLWLMSGILVHVKYRWVAGRLLEAIFDSWQGMQSVSLSHQVLYVLSVIVVHIRNCVQTGFIPWPVPRQNDINFRQ